MSAMVEKVCRSQEELSEWMLSMPDGTEFIFDSMLMIFTAKMKNGEERTVYIGQ